jgi:glycosyltransferase involved in cell wall biosynthesis
MSSKKILVIAWQWRNTGGDWAYAKSITNTYIAKGYDVTILTSGTFHEELGQVKTIRTSSLLKRDVNNLRDKIAFPFRYIRQNQLSDEDKELINNTNWYFVHIHSILGGPGYKVLDKIKTDIPIFYTLHDYHLSCPTTNHFRDGQNCMQCIDDTSFRSVQNNCRGSVPESIAAYVLHKLFKNSTELERVNYFFCPSDFMSKTMLKSGLPKEKLITTGYCLDKQSVDELLVQDTDSEELINNTPYVFYAGRLETYKGIRTLIKACATLGFRLLIAGDGSIKAELEDYIKINQLDVVLLGQQNKKKLAAYIKNSVSVVVPSEWHENFPFAITESLFLGTPVVGSSMGGIPELIKEGNNGYIFSAGDENDLIKKLSLMINQGVKWNEEEIVENISNRFNCENHLKKILDLINA